MSWKTFVTAANHFYTRQLILRNFSYNCIHLTKDFIAFKCNEKKFYNLT